MGVPETKTQRVRAVLDLLSRGEYSARDLTARLGLPPNKLRSVQRDLGDLILNGEVETLPSGKYRCPPPATTLNPVEALAVYSAARMLYHHAAEYSEHYLSALEKLTVQLPAPARRVAEQANQAYHQRRGAGGGSSRTFELVARAWLEGRVLRFEYHSLHKVSTVELNIYFIELNPHNRQAYAIGVNRLKTGDRPFVFRLARMRDVTLLSDECVIPEDFQPLNYLSGAWGIMTGDPVRVELFFTPAVRERVREIHLGPEAECLTLASGFTRVCLKVGGWKELVPWILGWGGEVEVASPPELRAHVAHAHQQAAAMYLT
ncbi:helix-turn-helix transcriptional regulator [Deinococcus arcticus]|uniref:DNA-binding transcriptional regulator n=1 Tax=Deinococcus arcticus TaxID=2136176 RepID=A0A2T3W9K8_9DEIO|nr:WYL domain-containing protein [Deinococcus arcticus]PTA68598.1 DNA-binding transcriptional regulator [Deinococcus arcticus]